MNEQMMVERVAAATRAAVESQERSVSFEEMSVIIARAAIKEMREPTELMLEVAEQHIPAGRFAKVRWERMIDAALNEQVTG